MLVTPTTPGSAVTLFYIDLDKFKPVKDILGHERGNQLSVQVAKFIRGQLSKSDMAAKIGDDEFAVVAAAKNLMSICVFIIDRQGCSVVMSEQRHSVTIIAKRPPRAGSGSFGGVIEGCAIGPQRIAPTGDDAPLLPCLYR